MIKVSILYPAKPGARFDHDYYRDKHLPMVAGFLGDACLRWTIDRGVDQGEQPFVAMCHFYCESFAAYNEAIKPHGKQVQADIAVYTDIIPTIQVSEVVVDG